MARTILRLALLVVVATSMPAEALRFYVNAATGDDRRDHVTAQSSTTPWKTIAHALRMAHILDGNKPHVVDIAPGTYSPAGGESYPLVISEADIYLRSQGNVILDAQRQSRILQVTVPGSNIPLRNFTLVNGRADRGGAVSCESCTLRVVSGRLLNNVSTEGGDAIYVADGRLEMTNNSVRFNGESGGAGPIIEVRNTFADTSRRDVIRNNTFYKNRTPIVLTTGNRTDISSNIFVGNSGDLVPAIIDSAAGIEPHVRYNLFWNTDVFYVSDDRDSVKVWRTERDTLTLEEQGIYVPGYVTNVPDTLAQVGVPYEFTIEVEGNRSDYLFDVLSTSEIPVGMSEADIDDGVLRWTPTADQVGRHSVRIAIYQTSTTPDFLTYIITVVAADADIEVTTPAPVITVTDVQDTTGGLDSLNGIVPVFSKAASSGGNDYADPLFLNESINRFELLPSKTVALTDTTDTTLVSRARDKGNPIAAMNDASTSGGQVRNDMGLTGGPSTTGPPAPGTGDSGIAVTFLPDSLAVEGQAWTYTPSFSPTVQGTKITAAITGANVSLPPTFESAFGLSTFDVSWTPALADTGSWFVGVRTYYTGGTVDHYFGLRVRAANARPRITTTAPTTADEDAEFTYAIGAVDDDGHALSWSVQSGPEGMTVDSLGVVRWTPTQDDVGTANVVISVVDELGAGNTHAFSLTVANVNDAPALAAVADTTATEDQAFELSFSATDSDPADSVFTFSLAAGPDSVRVDSSGRLTWTPVQADVGAQTVTVRVADVGGALDSTSFTITVIEVDDPPTITSAADTTAYEDTAYEYAIAGVDEESQPLTYSLLTGPEGMSIDTLGVARWTPAAADTGAYAVSLQIADPGGQTASQQYQLVVEPVNDAPVIVSRVPADSLVLLDPGQGITFDLELTDEEGDLLFTEWWVDGLLRSSEPTFLHVPDTTSADTVTAFVRDGSDTTSTMWIVDARAIAKITVATDTLDFGRVLLGDTSAVVLTVSNPGRTTLTISDLQVGNLTFGASFGTDAVLKKGSTTLEVSFTPTNRGARATTVQFSTNDPDHLTVALPVRGVGVVPTTAALDLDPAAGDQETRSGTAPIGDTLRVDVEARQALELTGYTIEVAYDAAVLTYAGFDPGTAFLGDGLAALAVPGVGSTRLEVTGGDSSSGDGTLGRIAFAVAADATQGSSTDLDLSLVTLRSAGQALVDTVFDPQGATLQLAAQQPADISGNGVVDLADFFIFADDFGTSATRSDLNGDGTVDLTDFFIFADAFGAASRPVAAAEAGVEGLRVLAGPPASTRQVSVDLLWQGEPALRGAGLWVTYDPRHLAFEAAQPPSGEIRVLTWSQPGKAGRVEIALAPTGGQAFAGDVGRVTFQRLTGEATEIRVDAAVGRLLATDLAALTPPSPIAVAALPQTAVLYPAHPNPFNPETVIPFFVPEGAGQQVSLRIFDLLGRRVRLLAGGELAAGHHRVVWRGRDEDARPVAAGVYLVELRAGSDRQVRKVLLLK